MILIAQDPFVPTFMVNDSAGKISSQIAPVVDCDKEGNFLIGWIDKRPVSNNVALRAFNKNHEAVGDIYTFDQALFKENMWPAITSSKSNNFLIAWNTSEGRRILFQFFSPDMTPLSDTICIHQYQTTSSIQRGGFKSIVANRDGSFCIVFDTLAQRISKNGSLQGKPFPVGPIQSNRSIIQLKNGNLLIIYTKKTHYSSSRIFSDVYAKEFDKNGTLLSNKKVNDNQDSSNQSNPTITQTINDEYIITWHDNRIDPMYYDIYAQHFKADGSPSGANFKVNDNTTKATAQYPSIASCPLGTIIITWQDDRLQESQFDIYSQRFHFDGTALGSNTRVNTVPIATKPYPAIACSNDGSYMIVWEDRRIPFVYSDIYKQSFNPDGTLKGVNERVSKETYPAVQLGVSQGVDGQGNQVIVWSDDRYISDQGHPNQTNIFAQRVTKAGKKIGDNFKINSTIFDSALSAYPKVAVAQDGNFIVGWLNQIKTSTSSFHRLVVRQFDSFGKPLSEEFLIADNAIPFTDRSKTYYNEAGNIAIAIDSSGLSAITWVGYDADSLKSVFVQQLSRNGSPIGKSFKLNNSSQKHNCCPAITMHPEGSFVVTWTTIKTEGTNSYGTISVQRFNSNGIPVGDQFSIPASGSLSYLNPSVAIHKSGKFIIVWSTKDTSFSYFRHQINAQQYSSNGLPMGEQLLIADTTLLQNQTPSINYTQSGEFCVLWRHELIDQPKDIGISGRKFTAEGKPRGDRFFINTNGVFPCPHKVLSFSFSVFNNSIYSAWNTWIGASVITYYGDIFANVIEFASSENNDKPFSIKCSKQLHVHNKPNPFSNATLIRYQLPRACQVSLTIYSIKGAPIVELVNDKIKAGTHSIVWNGSDEDGKPVPSGVYLYRLKADDNTAVKKLEIKR